MDFDALEVKSEIGDFDYDEDVDDHKPNEIENEDYLVVKDSVDDNVSEQNDERGYETRSEVASSCDDHSTGREDISDVSDVSDVPLQIESKRQYISKLNYLFRNARFFLMKSNTEENITIAKSKNVWATLPINRSKLSKAFFTCQNVILIFSAQGSGKFSGFARLASGVNRKLPPVKWVLRSEANNYLTGLFQIDWISRKDIRFKQTTHLYNPWNLDKPIKVGRDGQEIEPKVAEKLCRLFPREDGVDLTPILQKSRKALKRPEPWWHREQNSPGDKHQKPNKNLTNENMLSRSRTNPAADRNTRNVRFPYHQPPNVYNKLFDPLRGSGLNRPPPFLPPPMPPMFMPPFSGLPPVPIPPPRYYEPLTILPEFAQQSAAGLFSEHNSHRSRSKNYKDFDRKKHYSHYHQKRSK